MISFLSREITSSFFPKKLCNLVGFIIGKSKVLGNQRGEDKSQSLKSAYKDTYILPVNYVLTSGVDLNIFPFEI